MRTVTYRKTVVLKNVDEFAARFPQYGPLARGEGRALFDAAMRAEVFNDADALTRVQGLPAVTAVAVAVDELVGGALTGADRQFLGAVTCVLMEANGYAKTGRKRAIPHPGWSRGEVYELTDC